ncbi:GroES-like protein [Tilletiaria anomala UBC 951]|uniref:Probable quinone oxidoreductase n=1 Tax=Tilletiaria anomala (strain ATCC 24038 / CBS 436.72 / UBC 951) TaxID=1037660 RepID=A0A066VSC6_TILAU|nr:GroES-like protein [Tilletiaria anomala UBC 951]KDN43188.1 GroES-like protein [Tilletiaria anomala UBC 951]
MASSSVPSTMKALQIQKQGGLEVLEIHDVPVPQPGPGQVLLKVEWAGVNFIDTYLRSGLYKKETPFILGNESAGTIHAVGPNVSNVKVGDKASGYLATGGGYAEFALLEDSKIVKLPSNVDTKTGAGLVLQGLTAWTLVKEAYEVKKGDYVLVHAAAGGVGLLLCQMCKYLGAHVIGTTSTTEKAELAKANGAEYVILYGKGESVVDKTLEITGNKGVQGIFDGVGKDTWEDDFKVIARKGTIVTFGNASGAVEPFAPLKLSAKNIKVVRPTLGNYVVTREELDRYSNELWELLAKSVIKLSVHKDYSFSAEGIKQSQIDITSRGTTGKLLIKIS